MPLSRHPHVFASTYDLRLKRTVMLPSIHTVLLLWLVGGTCESTLFWPYELFIWEFALCCEAIGFWYRFDVIFCLKVMAHVYLGDLGIRLDPGQLEGVHGLLVGHELFSMHDLLTTRLSLGGSLWLHPLIIPGFVWQFRHFYSGTIYCQHLRSFGVSTLGFLMDHDATDRCFCNRYSFRVLRRFSAQSSILLFVSFTQLRLPLCISPTFMNQWLCWLCFFGVWRF